MCWSEFDLGFTYTELSAFFSFLCIFWKYGKRNVLWIIQRGGEVDFWLAQLVTFFRVYDTIDSYAILLIIIIAVIIADVSIVVLVCYYWNFVQHKITWNMVNLLQMHNQINKNIYTFPKITLNTTEFCI